MEEWRSERPKTWRPKINWDPSSILLLGPPRSFSEIVWTWLLSNGAVLSCLGRLQTEGKRRASKLAVLVVAALGGLHAAPPGKIEQGVSEKAARTSPRASRHSPRSFAPRKGGTTPERALGLQSLLGHSPDHRFAAAWASRAQNCQTRWRSCAWLHRSRRYRAMVSVARYTRPAHVGASRSV